MAEYQVVDKTAHDAELKSIGDSIRAKGGTTAPFNSAAEMVAAVDAIKTGGGDHTMEDALVTRTGTTYENDRVTEIGAYSFYYWTSIEKVILPNVVEGKGGSTFRGCKNLKAVVMPKVYKINGGNDFRDCTGLIEVDFPSYNSGMPSFSNCQSLVRADFGKNVASEQGNYIAIGGFDKCALLEVLILRWTNYSVALNNANKFAGSGIATGAGYVYVPKALVDQYKTATNWVTYASQIRAIEDYPDITGG